MTTALQATTTTSTFSAPKIADNPDGWGPPNAPEKFSIHPYTPFSKSDRIGRAADWAAQNQPYFQHKGQGKYQQYGASPMSFQPQEDDDFQLVDSKPAAKPKGFRRPFQKTQRFPQHQHHQQQQQQAQRGKQQQQQYQLKKKQNRWAGNSKNPYNKGYDLKSKREFSVEIKPDWNKLETIEFSSLSSPKVSLSVEEPEDLIQAGSLEFYDKNYDLITTRSEKPLERIERTCFKVTTTDDPIIRQLVMEDAGNVFATDAILSLLMACPRSVYSWDIIVQRVGSKLLFDKRDNSQFDYLTVNETSIEPPADDKDSINSPQSLSQEATFINQNFSQQVLIKDGKTKHEFSKSNPFASPGEEVASAGYRYRRWKLGSDITLVCRCEVDAVLKKDNKDEYILIKALNEYDPKATGVDWRQKLDTQRAAVLATELKNNANKLARWTGQAMLAGAEQIKIGYVSRVHPKDPYNHVILGAQFYKPKEFATQINLNVNNMWGILKQIIDSCMKLPEGKYVLVKDPLKSLIHLYEVPQDAFEDPPEPESKDLEESQDNLDS